MHAKTGPLTTMLALLLGGAALASSSCSTEGPEPIVFDLACVAPQAIARAGHDDPSGLVRCSDGFVHRAEAVACVPTQGLPCTTDASCDGGGRCVDDPNGGRRCAYGCETDADCEPGSICLCAALGDPQGTPQCVPADCATDADCGEGLCGVHVDEGCGGTTLRLACLTEASECRTECAEIGCDGRGRATPRCGVVQGEWTCLAGSACEPPACG